jgi:hypothetical protein
MLLAGATVGFAAPASGGHAVARVQNHAVTGLNAWDGRPLGPAGITAVGADQLDNSTATPAWDDGADRYASEGARSAGDYRGASKLATFNQDAETDALPLSQFVGSRAKPAPAHGALGVWNFVDRVRYGRLPEPASWALMLIGFGMIGGALRGFVVANRRLARLQPEDGDEVES